MEIIINPNCRASYIIQHGIKNWPIWVCEPSSFSWKYDEKEICLILEGEATIESIDKKIFKLKPGYLVTFPKNFSCNWTIEKAIKKHYRLGD